MQKSLLVKDEKVLISEANYIVVEDPCIDCGGRLLSKERSRGIEVVKASYRL
jgi:DNA-directed RNA polymerase subunit RPC12/RpoP